MGEDTIYYGNCSPKTTVQDFEAFIVKRPDSLFELIHGKIVKKLVTEEQGVIVVISLPKSEFI